MSDIIKKRYLAWKGTTQSPDAGMVQVLETRNAFFSGFLICYDMMKDITENLDQGNLDLIYEQLDEELEIFFEENYSEFMGGHRCI